MASGLATSQGSLDVTFYGMTEFRMEDPDGNRLWIGQDKGVPGDEAM